MDLIATIIITAFINIVITSIVSNFVFLRYQKRLEESFAKSLFEYETKFSRNHEKKVETLEKLFQDFSDFRLHFNRYLFDGEKSIKKLENKKWEKVSNQFEEIRDYFWSHRIFIDVDIATKLITVINNTHTLVLYSSVLSKMPEDKLLTVASVTLQFYIDQGIELKGLDMGEDDYPIFDSSIYVNGVIELIRYYTETIERIYREEVK